MEPAFAEYLADYTDSPAESLLGREAPKTPFLRRLLHQASNQQRQKASSGGLAGCYVLNGLECKLSTTTSKVRSSQAAEAMGN